MRITNKQTYKSFEKSSLNIHSPLITEEPQEGDGGNPTSLLAPGDGVFSPVTPHLILDKGEGNSQSPLVVIFDERSSSLNYRQSRRGCSTNIYYNKQRNIEKSKNLQKALRIVNRKLLLDSKQQKKASLQHHISTYIKANLEKSASNYKEIKSYVDEESENHKHRYVSHFNIELLKDYANTVHKILNYVDANQQRKDIAGILLDKYSKHYDVIQERVSCPECNSINVRKRKTMMPEYKCKRKGCDHEFSYDDSKIVKKRPYSYLRTWAIRYALCGYEKSLLQAECVSCGYLRDIPFTCNLPFCDVCGPSRATLHVRRWQKVLQEKQVQDLKTPARFRKKQGWYFLTLTIRNLSELNDSVFKDIHRAWNNFTRYEYTKKEMDPQRRRLQPLNDCNFHKRLFHKNKIKNYMKYGLIRYECTKKDKGWHPHFHILYRGYGIPKDQLQAMWAQATGQDVVNTDIQHVPLDEGLTKVTMYMSKANSFYDPVDVVDFAMYMKGRRTLSTFGLSNELVSKHPLRMVAPCPDCGSEKYDLHVNMSYEEFYHNVMKNVQAIETMQTKDGV